MSGAWSPHCRPAELLEDAAAREHLTALVAERGLTISALSCHANPLHPDAAIAAGADEAYRDTVRLAAELGVDTVITFSGCPGESEHSLRPSWVTCSWPDDFPETLAWQWDERVLPYWADAARVRGTARDSRRDRAASGLRRLQHRLDAAAARERGRERRRQLRSLAPVLAGHGSARLRERARRRDLPRAREGHRRSRRTSSRSTACSSRSPATARPSGAGSSARSAPGIPSSSGGTSSPLSARAGLRRRALDRARGSAALARRRARARRDDAARGARRGGGCADAA